MSFTLSMPGVRAVRSYAAAVQAFEKGRVLRDQGWLPYGVRALKGHGKDYCLVRQTLKGDVIFCYHRTDLVTWHPDGTCTVTNGGYPSQSTQTFIERFAPLSGWSYNLGFQSGATVVRVGPWNGPETRYYNMSGGVELHFSADGQLLNPQVCRPFTAERIDRAKAKALLTEKGYYPFAKWYRTIRPMVEWAHCETASWSQRQTLLTYLDDNGLHDDTHWPEMLRSQFLGPALTQDSFLAALRKRIYDAQPYGQRPYYTEEAPWLDKSPDRTAWRT